MWIILLFGGFVVVGLRDRSNPRNDTAMVGSLIVLVLLYVTFSRHLW